MKPQSHPLIGVVSAEDEALVPVQAPERPSQPLKWCSDCDCPQDAHAPGCPALRRSAPPLAPPAPRFVRPTWKQATAKALRKFARKLDAR